MYSLTPATGGHTVFPTVTLPGATAPHPLAAQAMKELPQTGTRLSHDMKLSFPAGSTEASVALAGEAACEDLRLADEEDRPYSNFFGIGAVSGDAIIFSHTIYSPDQDQRLEEWNHVHDGCPVY